MYVAKISITISHSIDISHIDLSLLQRFLELLRKLFKDYTKGFLNALFNVQLNIKYITSSTSDLQKAHFFSLTYYYSKQFRNIMNQSSCQCWQNVFLKKHEDCGKQKIIFSTKSYFKKSLCSELTSMIFCVFLQVFFVSSTKFI